MMENKTKELPAVSNVTAVAFYAHQPERLMVQEMFSIYPRWQFHPVLAKRVSSEISDPKLSLASNNNFSK